MGPSDEPEITRLLAASRAGDHGALDEVLSLVYGELRRIAVAYLRSERTGHTLQPTALVHEAYIRLLDQRETDWQNRAHFYGVAAQMMRRILVDHARARGRQKRDFGMRVDLEDAADSVADRDVDLVRLDDALNRLAELDPDQARVIELRYFGGLNIPETAEVMGVSESTVKRDWAMARAWLRRELGAG